MVHEVVARSLERLRHPSSRRLLIFSVAWPAVLQMVFRSLVNVADRVMVGSLGEASIAGVGISEQLLYFLLILFSAVGAGVGILAAQYVGSKEVGKIRSSFGTATTAGLIAGVLFTTGLFRWAGDLLTIMGATPAVAEQGAAFLRIAAFSIPAVILTSVLTGFLRAFNDNHSPMRAALVALSLDVILLYVFVVRSGYGVAGAGIAVLIGRNAELLLLLAMCFRSTPLRLRDALRSSFGTLRRIVRLGYPISIDTFLWQAGSMAAALMVLSLGTTAAGVNEIAKLVQQVSLLPVYGLSAPLSALIGQKLGEGDFEEAGNMARDGLRLAAWFLAVPVTVFLVFSSYLPEAFSFTPEGRQLAVTITVMTAIFQFSHLFNLCIPAILRAGGDTWVIIVISVVPMWTLGLPLAYAAGIAGGWGLPGVIGGAQLGETAKAALFYTRYKQGKWKRNLTHET